MVQTVARRDLKGTRTFLRAIGCSAVFLFDPARALSEAGSLFLSHFAFLSPSPTDLLRPGCRASFKRRARLRHYTPLLATVTLYVLLSSRLTSQHVDTLKPQQTVHSLPHSLSSLGS